MTAARITNEDRIIVLAVEEVPDMKSPYHRTTTIAPRRLEITYRWRETAGLYFTGADVSGPRRLKGGGLGQSVDVGYLSPEQRPDWVNELVAQHTPTDWPRVIN
ncbi:hypothetical protein TR51_06470 [Kitasatospora griseola]|uniref:Uncharacterized protein n=1 Tax=Kitasatospora griseola TaxID=2064 RepID=A0A0D0PX84_KITGR|nr:hypothetical protein [Kitasatospora griseola]KIQ67029.1 hypothetical protein TR51_06470 [Kitasatospora griseola]